MGRYHPEKSETEIFVGNTVSNGEIPEHLRSLKTTRLGKPAYDLDGNPIPESWGMRALFIGKAEADAYDRIMMARFSLINGRR
jgi:hypothetical protein